MQPGARSPLEIRFKFWRGQKLYCCPFCEFDSSHIADIPDHVHDTHKQAPEPVERVSLFDASGTEMAQQRDTGFGPTTEEKYILRGDGAG